MIDETFLQAVSSVGFPIAVSCYLLARVQNSLDRFSKTMEALLIEIRHLKIKPA